MSAGIWTCDSPNLSDGTIEAGTINGSESMIFEIVVHPDDIPGDSAQVAVTVLVLYSAGSGAATYRVRQGGTYSNILLAQIPDGTVLLEMSAPADPGPFKLSGTIARPDTLSLMVLSAFTTSGANTIGTITWTMNG